MGPDKCQVEWGNAPTSLWISNVWLCNGGCCWVCIGLRSKDSWDSYKLLWIQWIFLFFPNKSPKAESVEDCISVKLWCSVFWCLSCWSIHYGTVIWISLFRYCPSLMYHFLRVISVFIRLLSFTLQLIWWRLKDFFFNINWRGYLVQLSMLICSNPAWEARKQKRRTRREWKRDLWCSREF